MAAYVKYQDYAEQLNKAVHNWSTHTFRYLLSNVAPNVAHAVKLDVTEIGTGNGYVAGGMTADTVTLVETSGTAKLTIADEVLTAAGGSIGPFRTVSLYNDTATSPADALVAGWDYGSSITLADTDTFTIDNDATNGVWQLV